MSVVEESENGRAKRFSSTCERSEKTVVALKCYTGLAHFEKEDFSPITTDRYWFSGVTRSRAARLKCDEISCRGEKRSSDTAMLGM